MKNNGWLCDNCLSKNIQIINDKDKQTKTEREVA